MRRHVSGWRDALRRSGAPVLVTLLLACDLDLFDREKLQKFELKCIIV
jgi:hypothetical protein